MIIIIKLNVHEQRPRKWLVRGWEKFRPALLNCSVWTCLGPSYQDLQTFSGLSVFATVCQLCSWKLGIQLGMSKSTLSLDIDEETRLLSYTVHNSFRHSGLKVTYVSERIWIWDDVEYD